MTFTIEKGNLITFLIRLTSCQGNNTIHVQTIGPQSIDSTVSTTGVLFKIDAIISVLYLIRNVSSYL